MTTLKREEGSRQFMKVACQVAELLPMLPMLPMGKVRVRETDPARSQCQPLSDWGHSAGQESEREGDRDDPGSTNNARK